MTSPILTQLTVAGSTYLAAFSIGGAITYPTLLIEHFRSNDTSIQLDIGTKSWIGSIYGLAGILAVLMPIITQRIGRKLGYIITCIFLIIGWTLSYTATNITGILVGESFQGLSTNSLMPVCFLGITEMIAPRYRMMSMQLYGIVQTIGCAAGGILGQFFHYKTVNLIMLVPLSIAVAIALLWPESPSWLAYKGEFKKCETAFIQLRGESDVSKKELTELIAANKINFNRIGNIKTITFKSFWRQIMRKDFYTPAFHIFVLLNMMYWSGCDVIYIYFVELVAKSTKDVNATFYASVVMYCITIVGCCITQILVAKFTNKFALLSSTCGVTSFLILGCVISILQNLEVLSTNSFLIMYCLIAIIGCNNLGLVGLVFMISTELMPVKHRSILGALLIILNCVLYTSSMKISPYLFFHIGMHGTFLVYIVNTVLCALYVWKNVPETKEKTLQQIEEFYINGNFTNLNFEDAALPIRCEGK